MAHVTFNAMRMDFQALKALMTNSDFSGLIFQPILEDVDKSKDRYVLICYEMYSNGTNPQLSNIAFIKFNGWDFDAKKKVMFGNLPFMRNKIQNFVAQHPNEPYLYFLPEDYLDYVQYKVTTDPDSKEKAVTYELKPAPPAS